MNGTIEIENADDVNLRLCITLPLRDWKGLHSQLAIDYPSGDFKSIVRRLINKAEMRIKSEEVKV